MGGRVGNDPAVFCKHRKRSEIFLWRQSIDRITYLGPGSRIELETPRKLKISAEMRKPSNSVPAPIRKQPKKQISFYRANEKPYGAFSNLYKSPIEFEGRR